MQMSVSGHKQTSTLLPTARRWVGAHVDEGTQAVRCGSPCIMCALRATFGTDISRIAPVPNAHKTSSQQSPYYKTKSKISISSQSRGTRMKNPMYAPNCCGSCSCAALQPTFLVALHPNIHDLCATCKNMKGFAIEILQPIG